MPLDAKNADTMARYYERTNVGDFLGALEFLSEDVVYRIPGPVDRIPYSGEWRGKNQVMLCFEAFNAAFGLVDMVETRTVAGPDEVFSFNDEIFVGRSTGRPWRVGVVHRMAFDGDNRISMLDNYTDMAAAVQALGGQSAVEVPMLPPDLVTGEESIPAEQATAVVQRFYDSFPDIDELVDENATALMPGDPRRLRFAGTWRGRTEFTRMTSYLRDGFDLADKPVQRLVAEQGTVAALTTLRGTFVPTRTPVDLTAVDLFQITGAGKIGRLCRYVDTHAFTRV
jgi:ketosteroid isomerase-like protein